MGTTVQRLVGGVAVFGAGLVLIFTGQHEVGIAFAVAGAAELGVKIAVPGAPTP